MEKKDCQRISIEIDRAIHEYLLNVDRSNDTWESQIPEEWFIEINHQFHLMSIQSEVENYDWQFCTLKVYKAKSKERKSSFFSTYIDATDLDFWNNELKSIQEQLRSEENIMYKNSWIKFPIKLGLIVDKEQFDGFVFSHKAKEKHILKKIRKLTTTQSERYEIPEFLFDEVEEELDSSMAVQFTFLHELGILDFIRNKYPGISNNQIAKLVSKFTGINPRTSQPAVNSILNDNKKSKSYPLSQANIQKVQKNLSDLGLL